MRLQFQGDSVLEITDEAIELIHTWIGLAANQHPLVLEKGMQIACVLICAAVRAHDGRRIGAAEIYTGWYREIAERVRPGVLSGPPHEGLVSAIVANEAGLVEQIVDWDVMQALYLQWADPTHAYS